jgi:hypothetical protein
MPCRHCRDTTSAEALRAYRLDLAAALRERDEANRTGLELVRATNVLRERIRVRDEALKLAAEVLHDMLIADRGGWDTRHAAENTYCPDCATDADAWQDQTEHHPGCAYVARTEKATAALSACRSALGDK